MKLAEQVSELERRARRQWRKWGVYAKFTRCSDCGQMDYCRAARRRGPWLCLGCWDVR